MAEKMSKLKKAADATKNNVRVTEQVFSCVTDYAIIRGVDKVNVVTYLLYAHLPKKDQSFKSTPEYLIKEPPDGLRNAIADINKKTALNIALESLERSLHRRLTTLTFTIKTQAIPNGNRDN